MKRVFFAFSVVALAVIAVVAISQPPPKKGPPFQLGRDVAWKPPLFSVRPPSIYRKALRVGPRPPIGGGVAPPSRLFRGRR